MDVLSVYGQRGSQLGYGQLGGVVSGCGECDVFNDGMVIWVVRGMWSVDVVTGCGQWVWSVAVVCVWAVCVVSWMITGGGR